MTDSLETSEAEALPVDHFPDAGEKVEPPALISVPAAALHELLQAVIGPGHHIRELQMTRSVSKLMGEPNCIDVLVDVFNRAPVDRTDRTDTHEVWADGVMAQAQVFASAWALVGGRFDSGEMLGEAEAAKTELRAMLSHTHAAAAGKESGNG